MQINSQSPSGNYGGRIIDNQQGVKQFFTGQQNGTVMWIYKKLNNILMQTPANTKAPVYINDLIVNNDLMVYGSIYNPSDERLKENISDISEKDIDNLFTINPIHFSYKNQNNTKSHYGFLAQEVVNLYPDLVNKNEAGYLSVNYQEFIPIMLAKMKTMQEEIDALKVSN